MDLCSHGHDEIVYDGRRCPLCELKDEKESEIAELKRQIDRLESQVEYN